MDLPPPPLVRALSDEGRALLNLLEVPLPPASPIAAELEEVVSLYGPTAVGAEVTPTTATLCITHEGLGVRLVVGVPPEYPEVSPDVMAVSDTLSPGQLATLQGAVDHQVATYVGSPALLSLCLTVESLLREFAGKGVGSPPAMPPPAATAAPAAGAGTSGGSLPATDLSGFPVRCLAVKAKPGVGPMPLIYPGSFVSNGRLWVFGGTVDITVARPTLQVSVARAVQAMGGSSAHLPQAAWRHSLASIGAGCALEQLESLLGARNPYAGALAAYLGQVLDSSNLWSFSLGSKSWTGPIKCPDSVSGGRHTCVPIAKSRVVVFGGRTGGGRMYSGTARFAILDVSKPTAPTWYIPNRGDIAGERIEVSMDHSACRRPGSASEVIVVGGVGTSTDTVHVLDADRTRLRYSCVETSGDSPGEVRRAAVCTVRHNMLVVGGVVRGTTRGHVYVLDTRDWFWSHAAPTNRGPLARSDVVLARVSDTSFVVFGGIGPGSVKAFGDLWQGSFEGGSVETVTWSRLSLTTANTSRTTEFVQPRAYARGGMIGSKLVVFGGYDTDHTNARFASGHYREWQYRDWSASVLAFSVGPGDVAIPVSSFHADLQWLFDTGTGANAVIAGKDGSLRVHLPIVGLRCPPLVGLCTRSGTVDLEEYPLSLLKPFVQYLYTASASFDATAVPDMLGLCAGIGAGDYLPEFVERLQHGAAAHKMVFDVPAGKLSKALVRALARDVPALHPSAEARHCDLVLVVGGTRIRVHKAVVMARSPFFRTCLDSGFTESETAVVEMDVDEEVGTLLVEFLYTDKVPDLTADAAVELLGIASRHLLHRLARMCERVILGAFDFEDPESVLGILGFALGIGPYARTLFDRALYALVSSIPRPAAVAAFEAAHDLLDEPVIKLVSKAFRTGDWDVGM